MKGVENCMLAQWICDLVGQMHKYRISKSQLANEMGVTREYVSMILNGHREPADAEARFVAALRRLISEQ